ncbi:MAG TPA: histidine kinase [Paraburkholderia sp.]
MNTNEPAQWQVKLADLIDAMRKLCSAARPREAGTGSMPDARGAPLAILSPEGTFLSANRTAAALLGYTSADLVGRQLLEMAAADFEEPLANELSASARRDFHSFRAVLAGRNGQPMRLMLHQQSVPAGSSGRTALLTLFEESLLPLPELTNATRSLDAVARERLTYLTMGQQKERQRLSAELHDGLGQALTLVKLMAEDALMRIRRGQVDDAAQLLDATVLRIRETIGDVRQICGELRPQMLDQLGLPAALGSLCRRVERSADGISVVFDCDVSDDDVPEHLKADMFRLAQEALNNTVKHAAATEVTLGFRLVTGGLLMTILDNGIGYENRPLSTEDDCATGLGLIGMQHRVESHGGTFSIQSLGKSGTLVSAAWAA